MSLLTKIIISGCLIVGLVLIGTAVLFLVSGSQPKSVRDQQTEQQTENRRFVDVRDNLSFNYSPDIKQVKLTDKQIEDNYLVRLEPVQQNNDTYYVIEVRKYNVQLGSSKNDPEKIILENISKSYPERYPGFREERQQAFSLAGQGAAEIVFTYDAPDGRRAKQHLIAVMKTGDEAVYFSFQSLEASFDGLAQKYFDPIKNSIKFE